MTSRVPVMLPFLAVESADGGGKKAPHCFTHSSCPCVQNVTHNAQPKGPRAGEWVPRPEELCVLICCRPWSRRGRPPASFTQIRPALQTAMAHLLQELLPGAGTAAGVRPECELCPEGLYWQRMGPLGMRAGRSGNSRLWQREQSINVQEALCVGGGL